jgi:hypothetical protein
MVIAAREITANALDYRIEQWPINEHHEAHLAGLLDLLSGLGKEGWRVVSVDLTQHPSYSPAAQPVTPLPVLLEKPRVGGRPVEYRIERMPFQEHPEKHLSELLERLIELGALGWHVVSVDLGYHPSYSPAAQPNVPLPVLLEREV